MLLHIQSGIINPLPTKVHPMKKWLGITGLFPKLTLTLLFLLTSNACLAEVTDISQSELMQRINSNRAQLILDVRSKWEYMGGHIPGAINIPHDQLDSRLGEILTFKNKDVVLYCASGGRVVTAAKILRSAGFNSLLHLDGDMNAWRSNNNLAVAK